MVTISGMSQFKTIGCCGEIWRLKYRIDKHLKKSCEHIATFKRNIVLMVVMFGIMPIPCSEENNNKDVKRAPIFASQLVKFSTLSYSFRLYCLLR